MSTNGSVDHLRRSAKRMQWAPIDPDLPGGIHAPKREGDVGWDLVAMERVEIPAMQARDVPVNARLALPPGIWAEIRSRSSIARRQLTVEAGVIDNGYRGPLFVLLRNMQLPNVKRGYEPVIVVEEGERIGQLIFYHMAPIWADLVPEVPLDTDRGEAGFGSTGVK